MKILGISNFYPPHHEGGYEISVAQTLEHQKARGHQVRVLCGNRESTSDAFDADGISRSLRYLDYEKGNALAKHRVERFNYALTQKTIRDFGPDLVYLGSQKALSLAPSLAVQDLKVPHIFDIGDIWLRSFQGSGLKSRIFRKAKALLPFTVGGVVVPEPAIVPSIWLKDRLFFDYGVSDVHVVPRGVSLPSLSEKTLSLPPAWLLAGRIEPRKGLHLVIEALRELRISEPGFPFKLDIYGPEDPVYAEKCRRMIREYGLKDSFCFLGRKGSMQEIWADYDLLLMPTLAEEAFGRVIIEAMACGLPVLATGAWGPAEIITPDQDGWLFDPHKEGDLAAKIRQIHSLPASRLREFSSAARHTVESRYEISLVQNQIDFILDNLMKKHNKG
ncbi:MAG TPA: glycosyltransferase family 4 protein [Candidatus Cloacimonadota bacterium]|nr:glycosyltransferase family 4 protein [Candidatus Cloacimonadota bacterium]